VLICRAVTGMALLLSVQAAGAHRIAGNRFFVGMLTVVDPSVADEAIVPNFSTLLFFLDDLIPKRLTRLCSATRRIEVSLPGTSRGACAGLLPREPEILPELPVTILHRLFSFLVCLCVRLDAIGHRYL
jgi:hypothetical protein